MNDTNGFKQLIARGAFQNVTLCARLYRCQNAIVAIEGSKDDYTHLGIVLSHAPERFNTIHPGHLEVQEHQIGPKVRRLLDHLGSAACFPNDREVPLRTQYSDETIPYDWMVIGDKYADLFAQAHLQRDADCNFRSGPYTGLQAHPPPPATLPFR